MIVTYDPQAVIPFRARRGTFKWVPVSYQWESGDSYSSGYTPDPDDIGLRAILHVMPMSGVDGSGNFRGVRWDGTKLRVHTVASGAHTHTITTDAGGTGATGAEAAHTHSIAVTAGTAGDAVTNDAGTLNSTGGQDLTTSAGSSHTHTGPSHTHTGTTASGTGTATAAEVSGTITGTVVRALVLGY